MPNPTSYQSSWEINYDFIAPVKNDTSKVYCKACKCDFKIDNSGIKQLECHIDKKKHKRAMLSYSNQRIITFSKKQSSEPQTSQKGSSASTSAPTVTLGLSPVVKKTQ